MLKKTIKYTDFNGEEQTKDYYFNISKAEMARMNFGVSSHKTLGDIMQKILEEKNIKEIWKTFEELILMSVGVKSEDGQSFIKNDEIRKNFEQSNAYGELIVELLNSPEKAAKFIEGCLPRDAVNEARKELETSKNEPQENNKE